MSLKETAEEWLEAAIEADRRRDAILPVVAKINRNPSSSAAAKAVANVKVATGR